VAQELPTTKIKYILSKEVEIEVKDYNGQTALHLAFRYDNEQAIDLLLDHDANKYVRDKCGLLPIFFAKRNSIIEKLCPEQLFKNDRSLLHKFNI
jgi:ankyrin repeat protein